MSNPTRGLRPFQPVRFGRYTLLTPIAKGGMGAVYLARMTGVEGFEKFVVIKKILPALAQEQSFVERFVDEAKIVVKLQHGSIAQVLDMGVVDDEYYIAMEFVDGKDLRKVSANVRQRQEPFPPGLALYVTVRVLDALAYAHRKKDAQERELNLVHRDISPQNILVSYEGEVKVIDFGLAKSAMSLGRTSPSVVLGKFFYMSPEQARHQPVDRRSDLYATGICLWEMLAGKNPFDGIRPGEIMRAVANPVIPPIRSLRPELPESLDEALSKALAVNPDERYATAEEMRGRLTAVMIEIDPSAGPESLAAFMREQFANEFESERKAIATLARLSVDGGADEQTPVPSRVASAQAAFKPSQATGRDATVAAVDGVVAEPPDARPARKPTRSELRAAEPRRPRRPTATAVPAVPAAPAPRDAEAERPTPVGLEAPAQLVESEGETVELSPGSVRYDDVPPRPQAAARAASAYEPEPEPELKPEPKHREPPDGRGPARASQASGRRIGVARPPRAKPRQSRSGLTWLVVAIFVGCLAVGGKLVWDAFGPAGADSGPGSGVALDPKPLRPPTTDAKPPRGKVPDPTPVVHVTPPKVDVEPPVDDSTPDASVAEPVEPDPTPAETDKPNRPAVKLSRKARLIQMFEELSAKESRLLAKYSCEELGHLCSSGKAMRMSFETMINQPKLYGQLEARLKQWNDALVSRQKEMEGYQGAGR
ncbi:MAG: protein kinase domain-containing protein [Myxococcales bacterium]|jgi:serine/threonine protein kinase